MRRARVIFVNKSKLALYVQCKRCFTSDPQCFKVINKKIFRVFPGQYEIIVHYEGFIALIDSKSIDNSDITEVSAPNHSEFTARQFVLNLSDRSVKISFRDQVTVGSIIDGSVHTDL